MHNTRTPPRNQRPFYGIKKLMTYQLTCLMLRWEIDGKNRKLKIFSFPNGGGTYQLQRMARHHHHHAKEFV